MASVLADDGIRSVYQPIVDIERGQVVGWEALARGPEGPLERPDRLFAAAATEGLIPQLDAACRRAAMLGAVQAGVRAPSTLFVNVEADALLEAARTDLRDWQESASGLRVTIEITEHALTARPADLLPAVAELRERGFGIALDDVGADERSLALMPFLRPDVIKLDMSLVQSRPSAQVAEIHNAVSAHAERTGAVVLAEGIETEANLRRARAMGAALGQGWLLGRPDPLDADPPAARSRIPRVPDLPLAESETPFSLLARDRPLRRGSKRLLLAISRELEQQAHRLGPHAVVLSTFQEARHFTAPSRAVYEQLAGHAAYVAAFGRGMGVEPAPSVRGARLEADEPLVHEWDISVVAPHFAATFAALDLGDTGADLDRRFDFVLTHDRDLAVTAARSLMGRVEPLEGRIEGGAPPTGLAGARS